MKIIGVANQKDGTGKKTLLNVLAADYRYRVLVFDAESKQTLAGGRLTNATSELKALWPGCNA